MSPIVGQQLIIAVLIYLHRSALLNNPNPIHPIHYYLPGPDNCENSWCEIDDNSSIEVIDERAPRLGLGSRGSKMSFSDIRSANGVYDAIDDIRYSSLLSKSEQEGQVQLR